MRNNDKCDFSFVLAGTCT